MFNLKKYKLSTILWTFILITFVINFIIAFVMFFMTFNKNEWVFNEKVPTPQKHFSLFSENSSIKTIATYQDGHNRLAPLSWFSKDSIHDIILFDFNSNIDLGELVKIAYSKEEIKYYESRGPLQEYLLANSSRLEFWDIKIDSSEIYKVEVVHDCKIDTQIIDNDLIYLEGELKTLRIKFNEEINAGFRFEKLSPLLLGKGKVSLAMIHREPRTYLLIMVSRYEKNMENLILYNLLRDLKT